MEFDNSAKFNLEYRHLIFIIKLTWYVIFYEITYQASLMVSSSQV